MSTVARIAFDESGNTGANLLDDTQPVFVLASIRDSADAAALVAGEHELKFSRLRKSPAGRDKLLRILNHEVFDSERYIVSGFHKRFLAVIKIVDLLYEPLAHAAGIDLYERGTNLAMANMLYAVLPQFVGPQLYESILVNFLAMAKEPSTEHVDRFYAAVYSAYEGASERGLKSELGALLMSRAVVEADPGSFNSTAIDPAIPSFALHASKWTERLRGPFDVIHDSSQPIQHEQLVLEAMMDASEQAKAIGYDRRKMHFPLSATGITFRNSKDEPSIQLADIAASSVAYFQRSVILGNDDEFAAALRKTRLFAGDWEPVWPTLKVTPSELGTDEPGPSADPHDHVGGYISDRLGGIPPVGQRRKSGDDIKKP